MGGFAEFSCYTKRDNNHDTIMCLTIKIGVISLSFDLNNRVRLRVLEFFAAPNSDKKLHIELKDLFCPTIRVDGKYLYLPTEIERVMEIFGIKKGKA